MSSYNDNIYALSTASGKAAIAVIRVSGKNIKNLIKKISSLKKIKTNKTNLTLLIYKKKLIDQVIITYFQKPKSFTGEDMLEINCHGNPIIISKISSILEGLGVRLAEPGEFTKRALINDKLDLVQTESLSDLINAETEKQRSLAMSNLTGKLSNFTDKISKDLSKIVANIEALIDFSDEDLPRGILNKIKEQNKNIKKEITRELKNSSISKPIRDGFSVSVVGKPNTGKSSFINFISEKEISIVTNLPGTTTDAITSSIDIGGYKFTFIDTAGIRRHKNRIEEIGIKKTKEIIKKVDLNLIFMNKDERNLYKDVKNKFFIKSKIDKNRQKTKIKGVFNISSVTGGGINSLLMKIKTKLVKNQKNEPILSRERHINIMKDILNILSVIDFSQNLDILAFQFREALNFSLEINQRFDIEKILDIIFKDFCVGK